MKITYLFIITLVSVVIFSLHRYYWIGDYAFLIETPCDPTVEKCQYRACDKDWKKCLPNKLSYYKSYIINADDFRRCEDNTCEIECVTSKIKCIQQ